MIKREGFGSRSQLPLCGIFALSVGSGMSSVTNLARAEVENAPRAGTLEEVVVTARRRDESLSTVPIAVTAMGAQQLSERQIKTDSDLQTAVPGLTIRQTQGNNSLTYSIRGQTADTFSGSPSAVVTYFNDVPLTVASASTLFDLESVQVLKGPQGTLFGRNATGGAVLFTPAKPTTDTELTLATRMGNYGLLEFDGVANMPLSGEQLLLRLAVNSTQKDGYIDNQFQGEALIGEVDHTLGDIDRQAFRASLTWAPTNNLENTLVAQYSQIEGTNTGASYVYSIYDVGETNNGYALNSASSFLVPFVEQQRQLGLYKTQHPAPAGHDGEDWMMTNTTSFDLSESLTLKNILGVSHVETDSEQPQLGAPFATILTANIVSEESGNETDADSVSNEFQLHGQSDELTYIVGFYYQDYEVETLWPQTYFQAPASALTDNFSINNESQALYAQATYDISGLTGLDGLRFTAGARYTWEDVEIKQLSKSTYKFGAADQNESFEEPSWEIGLEYQITDDLFTYVKHRGSFRSGGFNGAAAPVDADATQGGNKFDTENVEDFELGVKFRGLVSGMPTLFNLAAYHQVIEHVQRVEFPDPDGDGPLASIAVTANVPEMEVQGFEIEASIVPADWLELGFSAAYTDASFTDGSVELFGSEFAYGPVGDTPENSHSVYAVIDIPLDESLGELALRAEWYSQSEQYFANAAGSIAPRTELPSYDLFNARLSWQSIAGSQFSGALFGKNLTDEEYFVGGMTLAAALGHNAAAVGEPRTYGLEISYHY